MLPVPVSDISKVAIILGLLGAFILAKNYLPVKMDDVLVLGRLQLGGNSFDMKDKIIQKYNAWVGFSLMILSALIQWSALELNKFTTWNDLKGRTVLFGSPFNTITTIAVFIILLRLVMFITDGGAMREYFPHLKKREKVNFDNAVANIDSQKQDMAEDAKKGVDQLLRLFDIKVKKDSSYEDKIQKLRESVFKE